MAEETKVRLFAPTTREPNINTTQLVIDILAAETDADVLAAVGAVIIASAQVGTLASPPGTLAYKEIWLDTTGSGGTLNPLLRINNND